MNKPGQIPGEVVTYIGSKLNVPGVALTFPATIVAVINTYHQWLKETECIDLDGLLDGQQVTRAVYKSRHGNKIFRMNDYDWWAGKDLDSVKAQFLKDTGLDEDEAFDEPYPLTCSEALAKRFFDEPPYDSEKNVKSRSFIDQLEKMEKDDTVFPTFFASTEW